MFYVLQDSNVISVMNNYMIYNCGIAIVRIVVVLAVGIQGPCFLLNKIL